MRQALRGIGILLVPFFQLLLVVNTCAELSMFSFDEMGDHAPSNWRVNKSPMKSTRLRKLYFSLAGLFMP
jgi:hypothetical protein